MLGEIAAKARDAASMFWQSLAEPERRLVAIYGIYVVVTVTMWVSGKSRDARRRELKDEILGELRGQ